MSCRRFYLSRMSLFRGFLQSTRPDKDRRQKIAEGGKFQV